MKKILLLMLPVVALSLASCEKNDGELSGDDVIEFKDPNFLKALLAVKEIEIYDVSTREWIPYLMDVDANKDGAITVNEAQKVKGLELRDYETYESCNISEMPEIKHFTSLTYLDCSMNKLTSLDLSQNTALTGLMCHGNQLTSLNVSNCTALDDLTCPGNQFTSLDLSQNTALTGLMCDGNQLTSLNVSNNPALRYLYCTNNQLTSLYVGSCPDLVELFCDDNQLTSLDVHYNRELEELGCSNNPLEKLIIYADNEISGMDDIESEYGDIIEYEY